MELYKTLSWAILGALLFTTQTGLCMKSTAHNANKRGAAPTEHSYSHFASLLAGVLLLREGGIDEAIKAIPRLRNHTLGHVNVYSYVKKTGAKDINQALANQELNAKLAKLGLKFGKIPKEVGDKINKKFSKPNPIEKKVIDKINKKVAEKIDPDEVAAINKALGESKLNTQVTPVAINPEAAFGNSASIISKTIIGMQALAVGVNFNPCLVSVTPVGFQSLAIGLNFVPHLIDIQPGGVLGFAIGANIQPTLALIVPTGIQATPAGARIIPWLMGVFPTGGWVNPTGAFIAPLGLLDQPAGLFVGPAGAVVSPVNHVIEKNRRGPASSANAPAGTDFGP
eukprot:jgi/Botrbrau1/19621/Bobra.0448s0001.1